MDELRAGQVDAGLISGVRQNRNFRLLLDYNLMPQGARNNFYGQLMKLKETKVGIKV